MADGPEKNSSAREYTQLLRLHEQLLNQFVRSRDELLAPGTDRLVKQIKAQTGSEPDLTTQALSVRDRIGGHESRRCLRRGRGHQQSPAVPPEISRRARGAARILLRGCGRPRARLDHPVEGIHRAGDGPRLRADLRTTLRLVGGLTEATRFMISRPRHAPPRVRPPHLREKMARFSVVTGPA
jgi:hypothetical protein